MAGLPGKRACVIVEPPLLASGPSKGFVTPILLPLTPFDKPQSSQAPIKLNELAEFARKCTSRGVVLGLAAPKLPATMVFLNRTKPELTKPPASPLFERLFVTVLFMRVVLVALKLSTPPPKPLVLPET